DRDSLLDPRREIVDRRPQPLLVGPALAGNPAELDRRHHGDLRHLTSRFGFHPVEWRDGRHVDLTCCWRRQRIVRVARLLGKASAKVEALGPNTPAFAPGPTTMPRSPAARLA